MSKCPWQYCLPDWMDPSSRALDPSLSDQIQSHVTQCPDCAEAVRADKAYQRLFGIQPPPLSKDRAERAWHMIGTFLKQEEEQEAPQCSQPVETLWKRYLKTRYTKYRNALVEAYASLVHIQAARLARKLPAQVSYDEICSAGYDGLIEAVEGYNPNRKAKFETFCQQRIIGAVMDWLRSLDPQSRTVRTFEKRRMGVRQLLDAELGRPAMHEEVAKRMGLSQDRYDQLSRISQLGREIHFSAMDPRDYRERCWEVCDPDQTYPSAKMARTMITEFVTRGLSREERLVMVLYYYEDMTMAEIGVVLDLSESRVSQIHKDALERLRCRFHNASQSGDKRVG